MRRAGKERTRMWLPCKERSKPENIRCTALYDAAASGDVDALLEALKVHKSLPPNGKSTGLDDTTSFLRAAPRLELSDEELTCTFASGSDLGVVLAVHASGGLLVLAFATCEDGSPGPAAHSGDKLKCGDVLCSVGHHDSKTGEALASLLSPQGGLMLPPQKSPLTVKFKRCRIPERLEELDRGGRPAHRQPKFPSHKGGGGKSGVVAGAEGGAKKRKGAKPQVKSPFNEDGVLQQRKKQEAKDALKVLREKELSKEGQAERVAEAEQRVCTGTEVYIT
mmetsp:Transcript_14080/g.27794  ORF Transcript_14080/g.27794 Transcript_14080/m.27794 type:complete len:279 (-) Transcript_14080:9-845(-)